MRRAALLIAILLLALAPVRASAAPEDHIADLEEVLPEDLPFDATDPEGLTAAVGFEAILAELGALLSDKGAELVSFLLTLVGIATISALGRALDSDLRPTVNAAISAVASVIVVSRILPAVRAVGEAIGEVSDFFGSLIPIFSGITLAGGGVSTASVSATGMSISLSVIGSLSAQVLTVSVTALFVLGMLSDLGGLGDGLVRGARSLFTRGIGIVCFLFGAVLALQTVISGASDGMMIRTARFAATTTIPVVGSTVSGAIGTLAAGLSYVKGIAGAASIATIVWIALSPLMLLLLYRFDLAFVVSFLGFLDTGRGIRCFSAMLTALDALIAIFSMTTIVYIFQIILFIKSGVAIL